MVATEMLRDEHEGILLMLRVLEKVIFMIESKQNIDFGHLDRIVEFFQIFADKCHHGKEEDLLFPQLERVGIPKEGGPISVMLAEHEQGRSFIRGMAGGLADYKKGDEKGLGHFIKNARSYVDLLAQHIQKENNVLFPMGDRVLSEEKQKELADGFEKIERERIGEGTHEEFHRLLQQLAEIYLK